MTSLDFTRHTLANGMRVVLHRRTAMPIACLTIAYNVGSKDESAGRTGFAHLFEHLMFDGSAHVPRGAFDRYCELAGGHNNAYTHEDKTVYYMMLPAHQLELGLWLESDRLMSLNLTDEGFETQRSVVMEEKLQRVDNQPYGSWDTRMSELLYPGHPYGHPVIGSMEDLAAATMHDVTSFHSMFYRPDNAAIALAGDIDPDRVLRLIESYFGPIAPGGPVTRPSAEVPLPHGESRETHLDAVPLPGVFIGRRIPPEHNDEFLAMDVLSDLLGSGESSRLHQRLVYEKQIAGQASAFVDGRRYPGLFVAYATATPGNSAENLEEAIEHELRRLVDDPIPDAELAKARNRVEALYMQHLQSLNLCADRFAHYALFENDPQLINSMLGKYLEVSADDIRRAAERYLASSDRVVLHYLPDGSADGDEAAIDY